MSSTRVREANQQTWPASASVKFVIHADPVSTTYRLASALVSKK